MKNYSLTISNATDRILEDLIEVNEIYLEQYESDLREYRALIILSKMIKELAGKNIKEKAKMVSIAQTAINRSFYIESFYYRVRRNKNGEYTLETMDEIICKEGEEDFSELLEATIVDLEEMIEGLFEENQEEIQETKNRWAKFIDEIVENGGLKK